MNDIAKSAVANVVAASVLQKTGDPHRFRLRICQSGGSEYSTLRSDVVVDMCFSLERGLHWEYVAHENYERPALGTPWQLASRYVMDRISRQLHHRIAIEVKDALADHFADPDPQDPNYLQGIDRRELLMMIVTHRISRMYRHDPRDDLSVAINYLSRKCGGDRALARAAYINHVSLWHATHSRGGLSAQNLDRLAEVADSHMEWYLADYFRSQARLWASRHGTLVDGAGART